VVVGGRGGPDYRGSRGRAVASGVGRNARLRPRWVS
jgi:hypothetical protein